MGLDDPHHISLSHLLTTFSQNDKEDLNDMLCCFRVGSSKMAFDSKAADSSSSTDIAIEKMEMLEQQMAKNRVYKCVISGGPSGGKSTSMERIESFFQSIGWAVLKVPEAATTLMKGGIKFGSLTEEEQLIFQEELMRTMMCLENTYFRLADSFVERSNVLVICDRGAMDPSAYMDKDGWEELCKRLGLDTFHLRETRYNQVVHMVTAADGAEKFYTVMNNNARSEGIAEALAQEKLTRKAWVGHPYLDIIDNFECKTFEDKVLKVIQVICDRVGVKYGDRLAKNTQKRKWLVDEIDESQFTQYLSFDVCHDYLVTHNPGLDVEVRLRKRGVGNKATYTLTKCEIIHGEKIETKWKLNLRDYESMLQLKDKARCTLFKTRRCFNYGNNYFHIDKYVDPLPVACCGGALMILETYTTIPALNPLPSLPSFMKIRKEITGDKIYSMFRFSRLDAVKLPPA
uniref:AAA_28 domain-containing protein n=1 Tax=Rhabditophanes sp. KR3021 TaxID=114890 RepID=A0AC35UD53_9BILA